MRPARILAAGLVLLLHACSAPQPAPSDAPAPSKAAEPAAPPAPVVWPTYHGSTALDGVADIALPDALAQRWKYDAGAQVYNTPVSSGGRIAFSDSKGVVHVLDLDGKLVWSKALTEPGYEGRPPQPALLDAPLAIFEDTLIACSATGVIHAWNVADGAERWVNDSKHPVLGTPNFATVTVDGAPQQRLYFIDQAEGMLVCLNFATGEKLWASKGVSRCDGSPSASSRHVVFGSCASAVHIFSAIDGTLEREIVLDEDSQVAGGVVLLGDTLFSGSRSGKFIHANASTGEVIWTSTDCDAEAFSTPAVGADRIVFGANDANLYALDRKTGALVWKRELEDTPSSAVIARDKILVGALGKLHLLRLSDGETLWSYAVSDEITAPGMAGELVVVGGDDGTVTAFSGKKGA